MDCIRIVVTLLYSAAFLLSLGAGVSALKKWNDHRQEQAEYEWRQKVAGPFEDEWRAKFEALRASKGRPDFDAFGAEKMAAAHAIGLRPEDVAGADRKWLIGEPPQKHFQAPSEVVIGLVALSCATAASIVSVWAL